jgi:DNA-3-methyladenine glycosylase
LIRALRPLHGIEIMQEMRTKPEMRTLTNGPGKLTQALAITKDYDGINMMQKGALYVVDNECKPVITATPTPRIGIRVGLDKLWRFSCQ